MNDRHRGNGEDRPTLRQTEGAAAEPRPTHPRTRAEERIAELDTSPTALLAQIEELRGQVMAAEQEAAESKQGWQRTAADFSNYRRRTEQDREANLGLANEALLAKLLVIVDDFDRAIVNMPTDRKGVPWVAGVEAIDR